MANYKIKNRKSALLAFLVNVGGYFLWGWQGFFSKSLADMKPRRILVIQLDEMGDVLLSTPALSYLRKAFPKAHITVAVRKIGALVLDGNPDLDEVIEIDVPRFSSSPGGARDDFAKAKLAVDKIEEQSPEKFDLGIDLRADIRTIAILHGLKIPVRVSQAIRSGGFWLTHVASYDGQQHEVERKLGIVRTIRKLEQPFSPKLQINISSADIKEASSVLRTNGVSADSKFVAMHIFAGWKPKEWPQDRFAELAAYLHEKHGFEIVILGTTDEAERINSSKLNREGVHNLAGQTSVKETAAIIKKAVLFVGNDSGPMHIASAMGTPLIALFGQNTPKRYGPWNNRNATIYHEVNCSPCPQAECKRHPSCMELIKVSEVKAGAEKLLKST